VPDNHRQMAEGERKNAAFEVVAVVDRGRSPARRVALVIAAGALVVVAAVAGNLLQSPGGGGGSAHSAPSAPSSTSPAVTGASPSLARTPADSPEAGTGYSAMNPGRNYIPRRDGWLRVTVPAGWVSVHAPGAGCPGGSCPLFRAGKTITRAAPDGPSPTLTLVLDHDVTSVVADVCPESGDLVAVGPTVEDLTTALANQAGVQRAGPIDVTVGRYPARKFVLTLPSACPGPEGRMIWADATTDGFGLDGFGLLKGGTGTVYVVDAPGDRLVITSLDRGATGEDVAQLDAIIASIEIEASGVGPTGNRDPQGDLAIGRHSLTVDGVSFSFDVATPGWEQIRSLSINKSTRGPQDAEAIIYWTGFPDGAIAEPCASVLSPTAGRSATDLAGAVAAATGTALRSGPSDVTVGGRAAKHVVLTVREAAGCHPGFFHAWPAFSGGAFWWQSDVGDTIRVWVVDVDGTRLFIAGETKKGAGEEVEREIDEIVASIQFD